MGYDDDSTNKVQLFEVLFKFKAFFVESDPFCLF